MSNIVELPEQCLEITPGYVWELSLDIKFNKERIEDIDLWDIESIMWGKNEKLIVLNKGNGISIKNHELEDGSIIKLVSIRLTEEQTLLLKKYTKPNFSLNIKAPEDDYITYFVGYISFSRFPPKCL